MKNCQSKKAMRNVINMGGLPSVTVMLHSSHARMLNEAIVALTTLTASLVASSVASSEPSSAEDAADQILIHRHLQTNIGRIHLIVQYHKIRRLDCGIKQKIFDNTVPSNNLLLDDAVPSN